MPHVVRMAHLNPFPPSLFQQPPPPLTPSLAFSLGSCTHFSGIFFCGQPNEMDPIIPIIRFTYLFLNVYDTYKVLKVPAPSTRNGGQPGLSPMALRKRDMKSIITIWTVWVCLLSSYAMLPPAGPDYASLSLWTVLHHDVRKHNRPAYNLFPLLQHDQIRLPPLLHLYSSSCEWIHFYAGVGRSRLASTSIQLDRGTLHAEQIPVPIGCRTGLSLRDPTLGQATHPNPRFHAQRNPPLR